MKEPAKVNPGTSHSCQRHFLQGSDRGTRTFVVDDVSTEDVFRDGEFGAYGLNPRPVVRVRGGVQNVHGLPIAEPTLKSDLSPAAACRPSSPSLPFYTPRNSMMIVVGPRNKSPFDPFLPSVPKQQAA